MTVWRITAKKYLETAWEGEGSRRHGGRWNSPGRPVVYTATTLSLAALELLVHVSAEDMPGDLYSFSATVPDDLTVPSIEGSILGAGWREYPAPEKLQKLGDDWLRGGRAAVISVTSAVILEERNYLLNPRHADFRRVVLNRPTRFRFDPRPR